MEFQLFRERASVRIEDLAQLVDARGFKYRVPDYRFFIDYVVAKFLTSLFDKSLKFEVLYLSIEGRATDTQLPG